MIKRVLPYLKNKYTITSLVILTVLLFFDKNDIFSQLELRKKLNQLEDEKKYFIEEIAKSKSDMRELVSNPKNLERFAREKYLMKKDNEDIFVIVEEKK